MRSWLTIAAIWAILAVASPAPLRAADDKGHDKPGGQDKAGTHVEVDHHQMERFAKALTHLSADDRKVAFEALTRNMSGKDRRATEEFFKALNAQHEEQAKPIGVEKGIFKGAIEVSLWTILVFLLLLAILRRFAWGPIMEGLNKREQSIARDRHDAELARKEAGDLRTTLDAEKARAADEIRQMFDRARQDAQKTAAEEIARGKAELQAERLRLNNELNIATDHAMKEVWTYIAQVATLISGKAIKKSLTEADHHALVDEAQAEFRAAASARKSEVEEARA
jgi:F-type H+-transporting ATPase subunit b